MGKEEKEGQAWSKQELKNPNILAHHKSDKLSLTTVKIT